MSVVSPGLLPTNEQRIAKGIELRVGNSVLIKVNQLHSGWIDNPCFPWPPVFPGPAQLARPRLLAMIELRVAQSQTMLQN